MFTNIAVRGKIVLTTLLEQSQFAFQAWKALLWCNRGQSPRTEHREHLPAPAWKAVPWRLIVQPSRQRVQVIRLFPRASPPVTIVKPYRLFLHHSISKPLTMAIHSKCRCNQGCWCLWNNFTGHPCLQNKLLPSGSFGLLRLRLWGVPSPSYSKVWIRSVKSQFYKNRPSFSGQQ